MKAKPVYWSPGNPKLYAVKIAAETDSVNDRIGFRTIETRGTKILLNGKEVFCRGVSIHEEAPYGMSGRAFSGEQARILLGWAKERAVISCGWRTIPTTRRWSVRPRRWD